MMRFSTYPKLLAIILVLAQLPSPIHAQSLQEFIRDLTRGGLVNNTPLTNTNSDSDRDAKTDTSLIVDNGDVQTNTVHGFGEFITVKRGDTLSTLARELLGDANSWREICALNALGTGCSSIMVDQKLELPVSYFRNQIETKVQDKFQTRIADLTTQIVQLEALLKQTKGELGAVQLKFEKQKTTSKLSENKIRQKLNAAVTDIERLSNNEARLTEIIENLKANTQVTLANPAKEKIDYAAGSGNSPQIQAKVIDFKVQNDKSVDVILNPDSTVRLQNLDGELIFENQWKFTRAFVLNKQIFIVRKSEPTQQKFGMYFDLAGELKKRTATLQEYEIEAITGLDLDGNGQLGAAHTIEKSGEVQLIVGADAGYFAIKNGARIPMLDPRGNVRSSNSKFKLLHVETFKNGLLTLYSYKNKLGTYRSNNFGEFQDWHHIKSYQKFFEITSEE